MRNATEIGKIVIFHRKRAGLSQERISGSGGSWENGHFDIEKGKKSIRLNTLMAVLNTLNITVEFQSPLMKEYNTDQDA
jgi:transcriptional regulator with XRE-family HTH domain